MRSNHFYDRWPHYFFDMWPHYFYDIGPHNFYEIVITWGLVISILRIKASSQHFTGVSLTPGSWQIFPPRNFFKTLGSKCLSSGEASPTEKYYFKVNFLRFILIWNLSRWFHFLGYFFKYKKKLYMFSNFTNKSFCNTLPDKFCNDNWMLHKNVFPVVISKFKNKMPCKVQI